jgi:raffinose/stachyose/melibiose transport system permease protein
MLPRRSSTTCTGGLPPSVQQFHGQYATDTAKVLAYVVLAMVPALAIYSVAERQLTGGLTSGAVKE